MRNITALTAAALLVLCGTTAAHAQPAVDVAPEVRAELCEHFAAGFTVEDSVSVQRALFGDAAAAEWQKTVEAVEASGC